MQNIRVYDWDYNTIRDICELNNVNEWEVIEAFFDIIREEGIDISDWF